jgi:hypothetical protein
VIAHAEQRNGLNRCRTIDSYVASYINDFTLLDAGYIAYVDGTLIDQGGQLRVSCSAFDDGLGEATCSMDPPLACLIRES